MDVTLVTGRALLARETSRRRVTTGCGSLDAALRGGLRRGAITEVHGASGCGKTQLCLQAAAANWQEGAVYVSTEGAFPTRRLQQLLARSPLGDGADRGANIYVEHLTEVEELQHCARARLPTLLSRQRAALLVLDSVAAPFRVAYTNYASRAQHMRELGVSLLRVAREHDLAVLCVNQVSASFSADDSTPIPSLGLSWSNMVSTRLSVSRTDARLSVPGSASGDRGQPHECVVRALRVVFAPDLPNVEVRFVVTGDGIVGVK